MNLNPTLKDIVHRDVLGRVHQSDGVDIEEVLSTSIAERYPLMSKQEEEILFEDVIREIKGFSFLDTYLRDDDITEIMINSPSCGYIEKCGELRQIEFQSSRENLIKLIHKIISFSGSKFDKLNPIADAWLDDGSRVNAIMPPVSADGPCITIRKFSKSEIDVHDFSKSNEQVEIVKCGLAKEKNIVVAGSTSSGKTTLLNALINSVPLSQRIISIEETAELKLSHPHHVRLVSRSANSEGVGEITMADLVKTSLRMRPDRLVVGEVRSTEAFDLIQAMNTGHSGSMCTIHANGPKEVLQRIASLAMFAHNGLDYQPLFDQVVFAIDLIIFVSKNAKGDRKISGIYEITRSSEKYQIIDLETGAEI